MLLTFRVCYMTYVVTITTCLSHVMLLNSDSSTELDLRLVGICCDSLFLLRAYSFGIESTLDCDPPNRVNKGVEIYHDNQNNYANTIHPKFSPFLPRP